MAEALLATVALAAAALAAAGYLAHRLRMPPLLGYLAAGLLLSPFVLGQGLFGDTLFIGSVAEVGVLFLLFLIGLELDLERLRRVIRATAFVLPFDILVPMVALGGIARMLGWSPTEAIALGIVGALSSTLMGERLTATGRVSSESRQRVLGVLISEDVAAGALLAILAVLGSGAATATQGFGVVLEVGRLVLVLVLLTAAALLLVPRILDEVAKRHVHELLVLWGIAIVVLFGYVGAFVGSAELGAFVAGVAAAEAGSRYVARNALQGLRDAAVALFFFAAGLTTDLSTTIADPLPAILVAAVFLVVKLLVHVPTAVASGLSLVDSMRTAFALGTLGEFNLILAAVATRVGLAHPALFGTIVGAMILLLPLAALLISQADRIAAWLLRMPPGLRGPLLWFSRALRRIQPTAKGDAGRWRAPMRVLAANLLLLGAWAAFAVWAAAQATSRVTQWDVRLVQAGALGIALAVAIPLARGAFRGYRDLLWVLVGLRSGERVGAGRVRILFVDAVLAVTAVLVLAFITLRVPATLPVLGIGAVLAAIISLVAWRRLLQFHDALEATVGRVLGSEDPRSGELLDKVLQKYPWGVRSVAVPVPPDSPVAGSTVGACRIGELTGAMVAVVQRGSTEIVNPDPTTRLFAGDTLLFMGDAHQLARAETLVVSHGDAMRLTAHSRQAMVEELQITDGSPWAGATLADIDLRGRTGALVAGIWSRGARHPVPYDPRRRLEEGDRLLLLGSRLQLQRAHEAAGPVGPEQPVDPAAPGPAPTTEGG